MAGQKKRALKYIVFLLTRGCVLSQRNFHIKDSIILMTLFGTGLISARNPICDAKSDFMIKTLPT